MNHIPVLLKEVIEMLDPQKGDKVLDCTVGLGGHAKIFLERIGSRGKLVGMDADEENLNVARESLKGYKNVELVRGNFGNLESLLCHELRPSRRPARVMVRDFAKQNCLEPSRAGLLRMTQKSIEFDIIFADLGLSAPHVDDPHRGFTYREDAPLDMRFDRSLGATAAELIEQVSEKELADILFQFGELRESRRLARAIKCTPVQRTWDLKACVENVMGWHAKRILPQVFQALRIGVNDELGALAVLLKEGPAMLKSGGRMGVISYHSLEDRMVKHAFRRLCAASDTFECLTKKPIVPSEEEVTHNPRSRSAKFRVIQKRNIV